MRLLGLLYIFYMARSSSIMLEDVVESQDPIPQLLHNPKLLWALMDNNSFTQIQFMVENWRYPIPMTTLAQYAVAELHWGR